MQTKTNVLIWTCLLVAGAMPAHCPAESAAPGRLALRNAGPAKTEVSDKEFGTTVRVETTGGNAQFTMNEQGSALEVRPGKGTTSVEVRLQARYVILPDFFAHDMVYDAVKCGRKEMTVPAENLLLALLPGEKAIAMCLWRGALTWGKGDEKASGTKKEGDSGEEPRDPKVDLLLSGEGAGRHVSGIRIECMGSPVYVGILSGTNIWHDEEVSAWTPFMWVDSAWKRPFEAKWRGDFLMVEGKKAEDWGGLRQLSFDFLGPDKGDWAGTGEPGHTFAGVPQPPKLWLQHMGRVIYPCWFLRDRTCFWVPVDRRLMKEAKYEYSPGKRKPDKPLPNYYERVLIYPLDRKAKTPLTVLTPTDIMRDTLGQGPCEYVLDRERVKGLEFRVGLGTCGITSAVIEPLLKKGEKDKGLSEQDATRLKNGLDEMLHFMREVNARYHAYLQFGTEMQASCAAEAGKNAAVKPLADKLSELAKQLAEEISVLKNDRGKVQEEGKETMEYWEKRFPELKACVDAKQYKEIYDVEELRDGFAQAQDRTVSRQRLFVKAMLQEIMLEDMGDNHVRAFADQARKRIHALLHNRHQREGL